MSPVAMGGRNRGGLRGVSRPLAKLGAACGAGTLVFGPAHELSDAAAAPAAPSGPRVLVATSGNHSETRKAIPITSAPKADRRVVMSMAAGQLPDPRAGDRFELTAELQATVDCHKPASSCVGRPYLFN